MNVMSHPDEVIRQMPITAATRCMRQDPRLRRTDAKMIDDAAVYLSPLGSQGFRLGCLPEDVMRHDFRCYRPRSRGRAWHRRAGAAETANCQAGRAPRPQQRNPKRASPPNCRRCSTIRASKHSASRWSEIAGKKDRAALAKLVVAQGFFWDGEKGDQADKKKSGHR